MIAYIKFKDHLGRWTTGVSLRDNAYAFFDNLNEVRVWTWLRNCLASWCLKQAQESAGRDDEADLWIARYQAIRGIK